MVALSLPSIFTTFNIAGVRYPLGFGSSPALHLQPLETLGEIRQCQPIASPLQELVATPKALEQIVQEFNEDPETGRFAQIALALLLLGHGYTDECHDLITPLSWPEDIHFAAGPSLYHQISPEVRAFASYTHCLVHRREAFNLGEFGMVGFANANYWSMAVLRSDSTSLPHQEWHARVVALGMKPQYANCPSVQSWCWSNGFSPDAPIRSFFDSKAIHSLCASVLKAEESGSNDPYHEELKRFAEEVVASEICILLNSALQRAAIDVENGNTGKGTSSSCMALPGMVEDGCAYRAMKVISSAHLETFLADGSIVLRRVVVTTNDISPTTNQEVDMLSAAAGIACRLLQCSACTMQTSSTKADHGLVIFFSMTSKAAETLAQQIHRINDDLSVQDCFALLLSPGQDLDSSLQNMDGVKYWRFVPCSNEDDEKAIFVDHLFGSKGETPTTVFQWSKGTSY